MANSPSITITRKIASTTEDVVCSPSDSALPFTARPFHAGHHADHQRHERRLDHADLEVVDGDRFLEPRQEDVGVDAAIEPAHQAAAIERRHRAEEGEDRHADDERDDARQHQHLDRIEAHGAQRVDLLAHLHGAKLGGIGAARAAGHHDGDDQHAELAQHQDADHVHHIDIGAEFAEMEDALLGDDAADQKRNEQDDRHRAPGDVVELMHQRGEAEAARVRQHAQQRDHQRAQHVDDRCKGVPDRNNVLSDRGERIGQALAADMRRRLFRLHAMQLVEQRAIVVLQPGNLGLATARGEGAHQPLQQPGAEGVEPLDSRHVDIDALELAAAAGLALDQGFQRPGVAGGPSAGGGEFEPLALRRAFEQHVAHATKPLISLTSRAPRRIRRRGPYLTQGMNLSRVWPQPQSMDIPKSLKPKSSKPKSLEPSLWNPVLDNPHPRHRALADCRFLYHQPRRQDRGRRRGRGTQRRQRPKRAARPRRMRALWALWRKRRERLRRDRGHAPAIGGRPRPCRLADGHGAWSSAQCARLRVLGPGGETKWTRRA